MSQSDEHPDWDPAESLFDDVQIPAELAELIEKLAAVNHDAWAVEKMRQGWRYGARQDPDALTHNNLVPYDTLTETDRMLDRGTAKTIIRALIGMGFRIQGPRTGTDGTPQNEVDSGVRVGDPRVVFDDFFQITAADVSLRGRSGSWIGPRRMLSFERGDSVAVVVHDPKQQIVLLVRQFRWPTYGKGHGRLLELVAGMLPEDETAEDTVRRELHEEIGYAPDALDPVARFFTSPGGSSERILLYHAEVDLSQPSGHGGGLEAEGEVMEIVRLTYAEAFAMVEGGEIVDAKTLVGLMWLRTQLAGLTPGA